MKTITKTATVYSFEELSETAKDKAMDSIRNREPLDDWWESTYEDAENVGLKITGFDVDRNRHATGEFISCSEDTADSMMENHGEVCQTYTTAKSFLEEVAKLKEKYKEELQTGYEYEFVHEMQDLSDEFLKSLLEDYAIILQEEYEYLYSDEYVMNDIEANEYQFLENGKLYH